MKRFFSRYIVLVLVVALGLVSCNKDNEKATTTESDYNVYSTTSTLVSSFSLKANTKILNNLDSVKFTIDQEQGVIYNADSLPRGTRINAMLVSLTTASSVYSKEFIVKNGTIQHDTTIVYNSSRSDSIDFSGDVTLRITSASRAQVRDYKVKINVHKQDVDTILWNVERRRDLPNVSSSLNASKTVMQGEIFLSLIDDNGTFVLNSNHDPMAGNWSKKELSLPFSPQVRSLAATQSALYMLDVNGQLFKSEDLGTTWTDCNVAWQSIIGAYGDKVLGIVNDDGTFKHDEYPQPLAFVPKEIEDEFPIQEMSQLVIASNEWTSSQQAMIAGGVTATGDYASKVWGYDGEQWAPISSDNVLPPLCEPVLVPYYTMRPSNGVTWNKRVTWLIMGGKLMSGDINTTNYVSRNQGINWSKGESGVQMPDYMPPFYGAQVYTYQRSHSATTPRFSYSPGRVTPVVEWACPYLYLFGGYTTGDVALGSVWEGVLSGLTFKPVF